MQETQETWVQPLGWKDLLKEGMATCFNIFARTISGTEEPGGLQSMGLSRQENWSGLPFPSPGDVPHSGIEPMSLVSPALAGGFFFHWKPQTDSSYMQI